MRCVKNILKKQEEGYENRRDIEKIIMVDVKTEIFKCNAKKCVEKNRLSTI